MYFPANKCNKCLEFMEIEKIGSEYYLICPRCKEERNKLEEV